MDKPYGDNLSHIFMDFCDFNLKNRLKIVIFEVFDQNLSKNPCFDQKKVKN